MLAAGTGAGAGRHRQHAEDERQRGHQDGAQALTASRQRGAEQILALLVELIGELDDQNGVFRRQADHCQQTHLEVHVILQPAHPGRQQGANHPQRHHQHHRERHRPALVQRRQAQEHHQQRNRVQGRRLSAREAFLVGHGGPFEAKAGG